MAAAQIEIAGIARRIEPRDREFELVVACCGFQRPVVEDFFEATLNWTRVLELAEHHRLLPALGKEIGTGPAALRDRARVHAWRALHLTTELKALRCTFTNAEFNFLRIKGPRWENFYTATPR